MTGPVPWLPGYEGAQPVQNAIEIHAHHPVPLPVRKLPDTLACAGGTGDAGIVAEQMHLAELGKGALGKVLNRLFDHDVCGDADGSDLGSHQAFWFAWSQFHPGTALW